MEIPELGLVTDPDDLGWRYSKPMSVGALRGEQCRIVLEGYDDDASKEDFHEAIKNFLAADESALDAAAPHIYRYYEDCKAFWEANNGEPLGIEKPDDIWAHIRLGGEAMVSRRPYGDKGVYVSLECGCDWEREHGLQIVFKNGLAVNKVGAFDGHLTNSDAYDDDRLESVIYKSI